MSQATKVSYVYFMQDTSTGRIKVGTTTNLEGRLKQLRNANPSLALVGSIEGAHQVERDLHRELSTFSAGGEWFDADSRVYDVVERNTGIRPHSAQEQRQREAANKLKAYLRVMALPGSNADADKMAYDIIAMLEEQGFEVRRKD